MSQRVFERKQQREIFFYIFSWVISGSFWQFQLPETTPPRPQISDLLDQIELTPLEHPPNSNISYLHKMGWYNRSIIIQVHSLRFLKVIHIGKWVVWPCEHIYNLGAYKVMYMLGIHNRLTPKLWVNNYNNVSLYPIFI